MNPGSEAARYDYPLDAESFVMDCGAYEGNFARLMAHKYGCRVVAFEPCRKHYELCQATCRDFPTVKIFHLAVGGITRTDRLKIRGDSTSLLNPDETRDDVFEDVHVIALAPLLDIISAPSRIDLLKLNVEGAEYEILQHALLWGIVGRFANIQVQWHDNIPNPKGRRASIVEKLLETHELTWGDPSFHENYALKQK